MSGWGNVMITLIRATALVVLCLNLGGCAAALVGGLIYKSTKSNEEKAVFVTNFKRRIWSVKRLI